MTTDRLNFNLIWAIKEGNLDDIKKEVDSCDEINSKDASGITPLHWAAYCGQIDIV